MKNTILAAFAALSLTAAIAPVASVHAEPAPSTLEQAVHANARIMHGGAMAEPNCVRAESDARHRNAEQIMQRCDLRVVRNLGRAADEEIGATVAVLQCVGDLRPLMSGRPLEQLAQRWFPGRQGEIPAGAFPADWVPSPL